MVPSMTALAQTPAKPVRRLGFVYIPMGGDITRWTPPGESGALTDLSVTLSPLEALKKNITVLSNMELKNAYPGHARDVECRVPERRQGQVDRKQ